MRYKVGDRVYLRDDLDKAEFKSVIGGLTDSFKSKKGTISKIKEVDSEANSYLLENRYYISDEMIDHEKTAQLSSDARECDLTKDNVNHPLHYTKGSYEVIDVITDVTRDMVGIEAVCVGNVIKYVARYKYKNGVEDLEKAKWYLNRLIESAKN